MTEQAVVDTVVDPDATEVMVLAIETPVSVTVGEVPCMVLA